MSEGIGVRLRSARERSRLTILHAAEKLHVDPDILEALEAEDFAALGAPVYVKGHLRHYAELVGEPVDALLELYAQGTRIPPPDLTRIPKLAPYDAGRLVAPAVTLLILFAVAGTAWWGLSLSHRQWGPVTVPVHAARAMQQAQPAAMAPAGAAAVPVAQVAVPVPPAAAPPQGQIEATFKFSADSWTEVYDATGRRLLYGLSAGPATRELEGVPPLSVLLGDARAVTIEAGGREASISRFVRSDHTARFLIAADGRTLAAPPKNGG
ncbi:MAG: helix-turn-helix domain-containing protein [Steroidobacteraceae bacterium]